jgi:predicted phage terminase large subunit-like protein
MTAQDRAALNAILRNDFAYFAQRCFLTLNPARTFQENWHIEAIARHLELVRLGKLRRLIINIPPRSLKSTLCSVAFAAFVLGHDPTKRIIVASYSHELAAKFANDCRTIMQSKWYRSLFPGTRISRTKNTETEVVTTRHGCRLAVSVGGTLTGRGGDILVIDDPIKPHDAYSDLLRGAVNDWFPTTALPRLDDKRRGAIVIVMQRLHWDDPTGRLLRTSDDWKLLSLPAIAERNERIQIGNDRYHFRKAGDVLHPQREPLEELKRLRIELGSEIFSAQYQQNPAPPGGNMIKREWVARFEDPPVCTSSTYVLQSYDTASKDGRQNDWSVCLTFYVIDGKYQLVDVLRGRFDYPTLKTQAIAHARRHGPTKILIEDSGVGTALVQELQNAGLPAVGIKVEQNKVTRMAIQSAKVENGRLLLPRSAAWLQNLEAELFAFPGSPNDDQVDALAQALAYEITQSRWTNKSLDGYVKLMEGLAFDRAFGRLTGRPW